MSNDNQVYASRANYPSVYMAGACQFQKGEENKFRAQNAIDAFEIFLAGKTTANASQVKVTKMLLIVSTVFVCLNLPSYTLRIIAFHVVVD